MRVTMKKLNAIVAPHGLEFVKGRGYFYFTFRPPESVTQWENCTSIPKVIPDSIYVYALGHQTWEQWEKDMHDAIRESMESEYHYTSFGELLEFAESLGWEDNEDDWDESIAEGLEQEAWEFVESKGYTIIDDD